MRLLYPQSDARVLAGAFELQKKHRAMPQREVTDPIRENGVVKKPVAWTE
jgi:hypothetical protein